MDAKLEKGDYTEEDVAKESVEHLIQSRVTWLFFGLLGGMLATVIISRYEAILASNLSLAFFIPIIVYLSDAVGTQAETIYVRAISEKKVRFLPYILKESLVGFGLGTIFGLALGAFTTYWLNSTPIGLTIGLTMLINLTIAPTLAVTIPRLLYRRRTDPALGAGPVATIIQDLISLLIYFWVASVIIF